MHKWDGKECAYDENGNPEAYLQYSAAGWTHGHRLEVYSGIHYVYNYAGIRIKKISDGDLVTKYALEGDKIIAQEKPDGSVLKFYYGIDGVTA